MSQLLSFSIVSLVLAVSPSADSFEVLDDSGNLDHEASHAKFEEHLENVSKSAERKAEFHDTLLDSVVAILEAQKDDKRIPLGDLSSYLANQFLDDSEKLQYAGDVAKYVKEFIEARSSGPKEHVPSHRVMFSWQEKGRGSGVCLIERVKA